MSENKRRRLQSLSPHAHLHEDLMVEIMSRLPAKSLLRFKSVSKQWKSIIQHPTFITLHHNRAHSRPDSGSLLISIPRPKADGSDLLLFSAPYKGGPVTSLIQNCPELKGYKASPSTHGLTLLFPKYSITTDQPVYVFNPTTQELVSLPPLEKNPGYCVCFWIHYSLGFDPLTGMYKVLSIYSPVRFPSNGSPARETNGCNLYKVFTLGTKEWRKLDTPNLPVIRFDPNSCFVKGTIYFKPIIYSRRLHDFIAAFHVGEEKFRLVSPPQAPPMNRLMELGDRLALRDKQSVVWILEDRDQDKWISVKLQNPCEGIHGEMPYTIVGKVESSNKFLLLQQYQMVGECLWFSYCDESGKEWSKFRITGLPDINILTHELLVTNNIETLFSPSADLQ